MNYYEKVANMLGLELDEVFKIEELDKDIVYKFTTYGIEVIYANGIGTTANAKNDSILARIIAGVYSVIKIPLKPKFGETYYAYDEDEDVIAFTWTKSFFDFANYKAGNVFKTSSSALASYDKKKEELEKYYNEN